jgi:hypothetical protein
LALVGLSVVEQRYHVAEHTITVELDDGGHRTFGRTTTHPVRNHKAQKPPNTSVSPNVNQHPSLTVKRQVGPDTGYGPKHGHTHSRLPKGPHRWRVGPMTYGMSLRLNDGVLATEIAEQATRSTCSCGSTPNASTVNATRSTKR